MAKNPIVRDYVSEQDSTVLIDYLMDLYTKVGAKPSKGRKIEDIPQIYSKEVAGLPVVFKEGIEGGKFKGQYIRLPVSIEGGFAHDAINREIRIDSTKQTTWGGFSLPKEEVSILRNWRNTLLHESFGHALPESIFGYKPKGTEGSKLSGRNELLPYLLQSISNIGKSDKELFREKNPTYPVDTFGKQAGLKDTQLLTKEGIRMLEPLVSSLLMKSKGK